MFIKNIFCPIIVLTWLAVFFYFPVISHDPAVTPTVFCWGAGTQGAPPPRPPPGTRQ